MAPAEQMAGGMPQPGNRRTLLCIDDDPGVLSLRREHLEYKGFHVLSAESGRRGLELLALHPVDCVIVDYQMPEMNGCQVAAAIKKSSPKIPVLMVSGGDVPEHELGSVDSLIGKQELPSKVLERVEALLFVASRR